MLAEDATETPTHDCWSTTIGRTLEKRKLVKVVTDAVEDRLGVKREDVRIILREMKKTIMRSRALWSTTGRNYKAIPFLQYHIIPLFTY